jgi:hypothetical protein
VSFFGEEDSERGEEANGDRPCVGEDSDLLPSACRDACAQQLRSSRPRAANCGVMGCENRGLQRLFPFLREKARSFLVVESFAFCALPAGGEQRLRAETGACHVVVA